MVFLLKLKPVEKKIVAETSGMLESIRTEDHLKFCGILAFLHIEYSI